MVERFLCSNYTVILCFSNLMSTLENKGLLILFFGILLISDCKLENQFPFFHKSTYKFVGLNASFCIELNNNKFNIKNIITFHMQLDIFASVFFIQESYIVLHLYYSPLGLSLRINILFSFKICMLVWWIKIVSRIIIKNELSAGWSKEQDIIFFKYQTWTMTQVTCRPDIVLDMNFNVHVQCLISALSMFSFSPLSLSQLQAFFLGQCESPY